jgi:type I restriction enzyme S subunit
MLATTISKGTTPTTIGAEFVESGVRFLKAENVFEGRVSAEPEFFISDETHDALSRSALEENDVLVIIAGATTGKAAVLKHSLLPANTNQAVSFVRCIDKNNADYICFWLSTNMVQEAIKLSSVQSAQPNLSMEDLGNIPCPIPTPSEKSVILDFLRQEAVRFDALIEEVQKAIELMKERRTALISAAVTGKIDVRDRVQDGQ